MKLTRDKKFYKLLLSISLPIAVQNLITFTVGMIDTLMVGSLGEIQMSSVSLANNMFFILMILMFGLSGGANILISQYWGKKDTEAIEKILSITYRACVIITSVFILAAAIIPEKFMMIFTDDKQVISGGAGYLRIVCIGYIFYALANCTIIMLRSIKTVKISMVVYSASLIVNAFFNWVLIFGKLGFPVLGINGAAIATVLARIVEFTIVVVFMVKYENKINLKLSKLKVIDKAMLKDFLNNTTPVVLNELVWVTGSSMISVIVGRMGTNVVAANSINNIVFQFVTVFVFGLSNASSVIIGNTIGEGRKDDASEYAATIGVLSFLIGIMASIIITSIRPFIVDFYNISQNTKEIAMDIMMATSITIPFVSVGTNMMMGVLRGGGDVKFVFINDITFMWAAAIPLGFLAAFTFKLPIAVVFVVLKSDEILKSLVSIIRVSRGKWAKNLTR